MSVNTDSQRERALNQLEAAELDLEHAITLLMTTDSNSVSGVSSIWHLTNKIRAALIKSDEHLVAILTELAHD